MELVISIEEARELLGDDAKNMTDESVEKLIRDLDVMAKYALQEARKMRQEAALALARLIYDIYKDKKQMVNTN
jgi:hypothetical protein